MTCTLSLGLPELAELPRRRCLISLLKAWPATSHSDELLHLAIATISQRQSGNGAAYSLRSAKRLRAREIEVILADWPDPSLIVDVRGTWGAHFVDDTNHVAVCNEAAITVPLTYYGTTAGFTSRNPRRPPVTMLRHESGDISISFDSLILDATPVHTPTGDQVGGCSVDNVNRFTAFLRSVLVSTDARHALLHGEGRQCDGPLDAAAVFHNDLREFVSDLLRSLLLMHAYLIDFGDTSNTGAYPQSSLYYFDNALRDLERCCTKEYFGQIANECHALYRRMYDAGSSRRGHPLINMSLLKICEHPTAMRQAISNPDCKAILSIAERNPRVNVERLETGWLIHHSEMSRGTLNTFYESLMEMITNG